MEDPGFYPLLADGSGECHLIHCEVGGGRIQAAVAVFAPGILNQWVQLTSGPNYEGDRCEVMLPDRCVNSSDRLKVYALNLPYRVLA
jgi:hypothetical protein